MQLHNTEQIKMDDFEYSVQITELDWNSFFQVCEECNIFPPVLAGLDDSGLSDMDERGSQKTQLDTQSKAHDPELSIDGPPDCDGSPLDFYLSKYGLNSPEQVLSGSEDDFQMEAVNVFFERLKSISKDTTKSNPNEGSTMRHSVVSVKKDDAIPEKVSRSCRSQLVQKNDCHTCTYKENSDDDLEKEKYTSIYPDTKLLTTKEDWSLETLKEGVKWDENLNCDDLYNEMMLKPNTTKTPCNVLVKEKDLTNLNQEKEANSKLILSKTPESNEFPAEQCQASSVTPRRKRRKKKKTSTELVKTDLVYEAQLKSKQGEPDEDTDVREEEIVRGTSTSDYWCSEIVPDARITFGSSLALPKISTLGSSTVIQQAFSEKIDVWKNTVECTLLPKMCEETPSIVKAPQCRRETDFLKESNLNWKSTSAGQLASKPYLQSPETGISVNETPQSSGNTSTPTNVNDPRNHSQLNTDLTLEIKAVPKALDIIPAFVTTSDARKAVSEIENIKPGSIENLALCRREFAPYSNAEKKATVKSEHGIDHDLQVKQGLNETFDSDLPTKSDYDQISLKNSHKQTNTQNAQIHATQNPISGMCTKTDPIETKSEIKNQPSKMTVIPNASRVFRPIFHSQCEDLTEKITDRPNFKKNFDTKEIESGSSADEKMKIKDVDLSTVAEFVIKKDSEILSLVTKDFSIKDIESIENIHTTHVENLSLVTEDINSKDVEILSDSTKDVNTKHDNDIDRVTKDVNNKDEEIISLANDINRKDADILNTFVNGRPLLPSQSEVTPTSLRSKDIPVNKENIDRKYTEIRPPDAQHINRINSTDAHHFSSSAEVRSEDMSKESKMLIQSIELENQLLEDSKVESTPFNLHAPEEENKVPMQCINKPIDFSTNEHEPSVVQGKPVSTPVSIDGAIGLETVGLDTKSQLTHSVFTLSSFWDEMEKLTINDILQLRLVGKTQHPSVLLELEDSSIANVTAAADSGYFTQLDEIKPDHTNMSLGSDYDEDLAQPACDATIPVKDSLELPDPSGIIWESDPDLSGCGMGMDVFSSESTPPPSLYKDNSQQCFRKMCKNISVQNLQSLEAQPFKKILQNASLHAVHSVHAIHSEIEDETAGPLDCTDTSSPLYSSDDDEEMDSTGITFSEILEYLFGANEPECSASAADTITASYLGGTKASVSETYDYFFSDFEAESFFYPFADDSSSSKDEIIPIFSCSRFSCKNLQFPEVYDYFFPDDSPVHSDEDEELDNTVIRVITRYDHMANKNHSAVASSDMFEHLIPEKDDNWNFLRKNPFSFRRIRRTGFTVPVETSSSSALIPVKSSRRSFCSGIQPINALGIDDSPFPDPLLLSLENRIFRQLAKQQKICREIQTAVADPRVDAPLMSIKQTDMCLVCIAFASWVLKSVNPQGTDTWKAVLLANVSALSAIRYLRRFTRDEAAKITPLRQIEPL